MPAFKDLTMQTFDRLLVLMPYGKSTSGNVKWLCACLCGNVTVVCGPDLTRKHIASCGCFRDELSTARLPNMLRHGHARTGSRSREYRAFQAAKNRCTNPNHEAWAYYGGRGIQFKFDSFEQWYAELGEKPKPKHLYSVDRIDNNKGYEIGNVRWATKKEQIANRRIN